MVQGVAWVGADAGIFSGVGVDVRFPKLETAGPEAAAGLIRGDWEFAEAGISPVVQGALDGQDTVILAQALPSTRGTSLIVRKEITEASQLNGTRIGVLTEAGQTTLVVRAALRELGINAIFVPLGTFARITAAVAAGEVDAGTVGIEYRLAARQRFGLDSIALSGGLGASILASTRRLLVRDRALVARVVEGYVRTIHLLKTHRTAAFL